MLHRPPVPEGHAATQVGEVEEKVVRLGEPDGEGAWVLALDNVTAEEGGKGGSHLSSPQAPLVPALPATSITSPFLMMSPTPVCTVLAPNDVPFIPMKKPNCL